MDMNDSELVSTTHARTISDPNASNTISNISNISGMSLAAMNGSVDHMSSGPATATTHATSKSNGLPPPQSSSSSSQGNSAAAPVSGSSSSYGSGRANPSSSRPASASSMTAIHDSRRAALETALDHHHHHQDSSRQQQQLEQQQRDHRFHDADAYYDGDERERAEDEHEGIAMSSSRNSTQHPISNGEFVAGNGSATTATPVLPQKNRSTTAGLIPIRGEDEKQTRVFAASATPVLPQKGRGITSGLQPSAPHPSSTLATSQRAINPAAAAAASATPVLPQKARGITSDLGANSSTSRTVHPVSTSRSDANGASNSSTGTSAALSLEERRRLLQMKTQAIARDSADR